ncbi:Oidioi.mRNA.OKI2018_I69.PAR.g13118.t1.cds [Oikopleura dioica]|uniref:Oidioi.mRNA.OKI2018_I69.PAR.g13118.t1.cds n=1 Tax=Oikopleura dioica TaxID=34765 RepID=A0ABN7SB52_OIKDI|nr:Oidioi.mRNA.OKI2018_I69.PAR.g13118.t1.cds [Oikopleura dioica]
MELEDGSNLLTIGALGNDSIVIKSDFFKNERILKANILSSNWTHVEINFSANKTNLEIRASSESIKEEIKEEFLLLENQTLKILKLDQFTFIKKFSFFKTNQMESPKNSILVVLEDLRLVYSISEDGKINKKASVFAGRNDYAQYAQFALVKNQLHIFGGQSDMKKIARLEGCVFKELAARLNSYYAWGSAAVALDGGNKALICFDYSRGDSKNCDLFDGEQSLRSFKTVYQHWWAKLALYKGQATSVGSYYKEGQKKVETLGTDGWTFLPDAPMATWSHTLLGLPSGALFVIGGYDEDPNIKGLTNKIWKLKDNVWFEAGKMEKSISKGSAILTENSIFVFPGDDSGSDEHPIQRIDLEDEAVASTTVIGNNPGYRVSPVLFHTVAGQCVTA